MKPMMAAAIRVLLDLSQGWATGISPSESIRKAETRAGLELRVAPPLSLRFELAAVRFAGSRDGRDAGVVGLTALPLLSWHFWRLGPSSLTFDFGLGGAWFSRPFPPGGTALDGYSTVGLGTRIALGHRLFATADARGFHHSNGRGFVADNPAFDGIGVDVGVGLDVTP